MKRLCSVVTLCGAVAACGPNRSITNSNAQGPEPTGVAAFELALTDGNYYLCVRRDTSYRDGGVTLELANRDTVAHSVEITGVVLRTVDGALVARAGSFGLFDGRLPEALGPGAEVRDWIGFGAADALHDDIEGEQLLVEVEFLVDGEPELHTSDPFAPLVDAQPDQTTACPV